LAAFDGSDGAKLWRMAALFACAACQAVKGVSPQDGGIPIRFHLDKPGYVTLVIDDSQGRRVRNLISDTPFPAGDNVVRWDGLDDRTPDTNAAAHGVYHIAGHLVSPGSYRVRGLVHPKLDLVYEMTPYTHGNPPWRSRNPGSEWLANHSPPSAVLFLPAGTGPVREGKPESAGPQILVGSYVTEGGSGLAWLDLSGNKIYGQAWLGGNWTGATQLARDFGPKAQPGIYAYAAAAWEDSLRLVELTDPGQSRSKPADPRLGLGGDSLLLDPPFRYPSGLKFTDRENKGRGIGGLAVYNGLLVASLPAMNELLFVDAGERNVLGSLELKDPRGVAFDQQGRLLAISGCQVFRYSFRMGLVRAMPDGPPSSVIGSDLEDPQQITRDPRGRILISDWGHSHQVKVFTPSGRYVGAIGDPGAPSVGRYDPRHMNHPYGLTVDGNGHLWVAEQDEAPKRISEWTLSGRLLNAFYGPTQYGGGGAIDPEDKTRFFYADKGGGQELKLDYKTGKGMPVAIYYRPEFNSIAPGWTEPPETPIHRNSRTYLTDAYTANPTNGIPTATIWILKNGVACPVAAVGETDDPMMESEVGVFQGARSSEPKSGAPPGIFVWSDLNGDGRMEPDEIRLIPGRTGSVLVMPDLTVTTGSGLVLRPTGMTSMGAPVYHAEGARRVPVEPQARVSTGGGQMLEDEAGRVVFTTAPKPFSPYGFAGVENGEVSWFYPSLWPGLHASHIAPLPEEPGEVIGSTRILGPAIRLPGSDGTYIWAINGNKGTIYLFTTDGLFLATLYQDSRTVAWDSAAARRGMPVGKYSLGEECFYPTITEAADGDVYLQSGFYGQVVRLEGMRGVRRLPNSELTVDSHMLALAEDALRQGERNSRRNDAVGRPILNVPILANPPSLSNWKSDWSGVERAEIDRRDVQTGDWSRRTIVTDAALAVSSGRLYVLLETDDPHLLENSGAAPAFASGGGLDLMIGADPNADPNRRQAVAGDERLLVFRVKERTIALLFRPVDRSGSEDPWEFSSPLGSVRFDHVDDVSSEVSLTSRAIYGGHGSIQLVLYELSVPLGSIQLKPNSNTRIGGDIGVLRGNGNQTLQRSYWSNKATGLNADVLHEAELTPDQWGELEFVDSQSLNEPAREPLTVGESHHSQ
jgi:hypothetical protein